MQAKDIYALVSQRLQDMDDPRRWPWDAPADDNEVSLQRFLNAALLLVATQRPDATATTKDLTLVAGGIQELAADDLFLLDCLYVLDDSDDPLRSVTRIDRRDIDTFNTGWMLSSGDIWHWAYDRTENPRHFWVIGPATAGQKIKAVVGERPVTVSAKDDELNISPLYQLALSELVLYQVFASDTSDTNYQKGMAALENFAQVMGIKLRADLMAPFKPGEKDG